MNDVLLVWAEQSVAYATPGSHRSEPRARRGLNVAVAAIGLILSAPLMLVLAALIKLTSRGPVFYRQTRVGIDRRSPWNDGGNHRRVADFGGKPFTIYKFRTMRTAGPSGERQVWAIANDPRVTRLGRILRQFRLDELPQLFNVLRGDMSLVGPRPERPVFIEEFKRQIPKYHLRHKVKAGITGWAQINHHYDESIEDVKRKVAFDIDYITRQSLAEDVKIMLRTAPAMVLQKGAM